MSRIEPGMGSGRRDPASFLRQALITGTAIVVPVLVTAVVLLVALDLLSGLLDPLVIPIREAMGLTGSGGGETALAELIAFVVLVTSILVVGIYSESSVGGLRLKDGLDATMSRIPGVGSIYGPLDRISEMLLEGDTDNFQEVVLVEYPQPNSYCVAFKTAEPPAGIRSAVEHEEMVTVFMPMGPNPFMGGFIMHVAADEVYDVDLSVEEGITSIVSFGVAVESEEPPEEVAGRVERIEAEG